MKDSIPMQGNHDECYKQISYTNEYLKSYEKEFTIKINLINRFRLVIFVLLVLTSQSNALPIPLANYNQAVNPSYVQKSPLSSIVTVVEQSDHSTPSIYPRKVYRHFSIPSYSNGAAVQVYKQANFSNQQPIRRERFRRTIIDKIFISFDEDADGQLSKDELYSLSLRLNIFPKLNHFLKQASSSSQE